MNSYQWKTAEEMDMELANRVRNVRKRRKISQEELSKKSGVSFGSIKRFEATGMISLLSLTKLAVALGCSDEITEMFGNVGYNSIEEVINENK